MVGSYKSGVTRRIHASGDEPEIRVWQSRYHDHIIRSADDLDRIRAYIATNPACWESDSLFS